MHPPVHGHLETLLLAVLAQGPTHGYSVIERLRSRSGGVFDLAEGTVYPALHRLERSGAVVSRWVVVDGRRRRVYELTAQGAPDLVDRRRHWQEFAAAVEAVLGEATWPATS
jgi:PadR family transcriptional regulator, regulatory protein PadR